VILCGVHLNMCVLGRPFAIRQMVKLGKHVALMRDLTDTMYNPERPPGVSHFQGTELVIQHIEKYWCPSFTSSDLTGKPPTLNIQKLDGSQMSARALAATATKLVVTSVELDDLPRIGASGPVYIYAVPSWVPRASFLPFSEASFLNER